MSQLTALLDANVLYPAPIRDILMQLAVEDLFRQNGPPIFTVSGLKHCSDMSGIYGSGISCHAQNLCHG
jgi:hypothetical protein